ncbi:MAG: hypothetical protein IPP32_12790 [Bacteroidetes bacterium]|nr:hypothetical protein [Bacteroidota bacterium]
MKKIRPRFLLFLLIGVFQANFSNAQLGSYVFTKDTATYITITGGTALGPTQSSSPVGPYSSYFFGNLANLNGSSNSAPLPGFPIGFNFVFDGNTFDRFIIGSDGWIKLGNSGQSISTCGGFTSINYMYSTMALSAISCATNIISIFRIDLSTWELVPQASGVGRLRYLLSGTSPSRKLIIQWEKFNLFHSWNAGEFYKVNFQLTLNEGTNSIQFHYGPMTNHYGISDSLGIEVGIKGLGQFNGLMCQADSSWDSTQVFLGTPAKCNLSPTVKPSNGLRFTLSPGSVCAGTPNAGVAISNLKYVCPSDNDTISLVGNDYGAGISYKWESSNDTLLWSPISGKINRFMVVNQSATKYYRCIVSCSSGSSDTSEFVKVTQKQAYLCSLCKGSTATCKFAGNTSPL